MLRRVMVVAALALVWSASANAATEQLTIPMSDGARLACSVVTPDTAGPAAFPGVVLFHGLGGRHQDMERIAQQFLAPAGYETLECDARGHGASEGLFGLDGPRDVQDTRELFDWFSKRLGSSNIGALGVSLGGGAVWNALTVGVPFKAAVPIITWTNLLTSLAPQGLSKSGLVQYLAGLVPTSRWDPQLLAASAGLTSSADLTAAGALSTARSPLSKLRSITTPTLIVQGRHDFLFDVDQALAAYRVLPTAQLYLGDLGHSPAPNPPAEAPVLYGRIVEWLDRWLKPNRPPSSFRRLVFLAHDPWDGAVQSYAGIPPTKTISVNLPGSTTLSGATAGLARGVRVTGGPHETFGQTTVTVHYSGAQSWDRLVAVLATGRNVTPITVGGARLTGSSGTVTIRLMSEAVKIPAGRRLLVYLSSTSLPQNPADPLYLASVPPTAKITIGRVTLRLSVLKKAVSK